MSEKREGVPPPAGARVTATAKALRVLDCFSPTQPELSLAQISRMLQMPKSTLLNQLRTLEEAGFFMRATGTSTYYGNTSTAEDQSVAGGTVAAIGTVVDVQFANVVEDGAVTVD